MVTFVPETAVTSISMWSVLLRSVRKLGSGKTEEGMLLVQVTESFWRVKVLPTETPGRYAVLGTKTMTSVECCSPLLVPVMVTEYVPGVEPLQVSEDVREGMVLVRVTLVGLRLQCIA